jgi:hypothetical protein
LLTFATDVITAQGTTTGADDSVFLTTLDCTGYPTAGPDVFFKVQLVQGFRYRFQLQGTGFNAAIYLFTSCSNVASTCGKGMGADQRDVGQYPEEILFVPPATAIYYVGVDGRTASDAGPFTLTITREKLPLNDTCPAAAPLTLIGGWVQATGDTSQGQNDMDLAATNCVSFGPPALGTPGPDLFYVITVGATGMYAFDAKPTGGSDYCPALYVFSDCAKPEDTGRGCNSPNMPAGPAHLEVVLYPGQYYIGVDSVADAGITYQGPFSLEVKQIP